MEYVYKLIKKTKCVYVGITNNPTSRFKSHQKSGKDFDSIEMVFFGDRESALKEEVRLIKELKPKLNKANVRLVENGESNSSVLMLNTSIESLSMMASISRVDVKVILAIASLMDKTGFVKVSHATVLKNKALGGYELTKSAYYRSIKNLTDSGLITKANEPNSFLVNTKVFR